MNEKLKELERRQREIADEIAKLREQDPKFIRGKFYQVKGSSSVVLCTNDKGAYSYTFDGINIYRGYYFLKDSARWNKKLFTEVLPRWRKPNPLGLENPDLDWSAKEHDPKDIPDKWGCWVWDDDRKNLKFFMFFDKRNNSTFGYYGERNKYTWDHYLAVPIEDWPDWAYEAYEKLED